MDSIVYHGNPEEFDNIKKGFTQVILHQIASSRNDCEFLIPARKIIVEKEINRENEYYGFLLENLPVFIQEERLELDSYQFCMQIYGGDFPEEFQDVFYLDDSMVYLFLNKECNLNNVGLFFTQCS